MSKIAIISQAEQGVLIDISGCSSLQEAKQYLTSTLQVSSQFWEGLIVDLNLGPLVLTPEQVNEIQAIVSEVGVHARQIYSLSPITRSSLLQCSLPLAMGQDDYANIAIPVAAAPVKALVAESDAGAAYLYQSTATATVEPVEALAGDSFDAPPVAAGVVPKLEAAETSSGKRQSLPDLFLAARSAEFSTSQQTQAPPAVTVIPEAKLNPIPQTAANRPPSTPAVLMMKQTLRSGQSVTHRGHLVVIGDVNPGAELVADGDITVWGALRGMAHAGAGGNTNAEIRALKFEALQLRIAHAIARSPDRNKAASTVSSGPETARIVDGKIRISGSEPD